jgi:4-amino-4-deoxy-L-arabinose transferase-like glycosyltransferase
MTTSTVASDKAKIKKTALFPSPRWQNILLWGVPLALLIIAFGMRLYNLGQPFDHDGYDEGVYWQSLLAMRAGYTLYQQIFYSQPPFFLLSTYPIFALFGSTLWSARLGIALVSLVGFLGAYLMGKALSGRLGAIVAMLLLVVDPLYFSQSQKIEAEVSSAAFSFVAVGAAYLWWENPEGTAGVGNNDTSLYLAALSGITLSLGVLCKLLSVTSIVPIAMLVLARLWQIWRKQLGTNRRRRSLRPIIILIIASIVTALLLLLPFLGSSTAMFRDVVMFHTDARITLINNQVHNIQILQNFAQTNLLLLIAAAYGLVVALIRRDWRVIPLLAWTFVSLALLWEEVPLFYRHFITLIPPLIAIAIMGIGGGVDPSPVKGFLSKFKLPFVMPSLAVLLILAVVVTDIQTYQPYYQYSVIRGNDSFAHLEAHVANDVRNSITPDQLVVTDGQFVAALADRNTPPDLVDTSIVRIVSGYMTNQQLINEASQPQVHAVLFFMDRLRLPQLKAFYTWVTQHFHLKYDYGHGKQLWVR